MNHEEIFEIIPGSIVPGNMRSYPVNAVATVELNLRQKDGTSIPGRSVSVNDELTVIDVSESRQLALVQYPSGGDIRQGYVTNNAKYINYLNPSNWHNGTTSEEVINYDGSNLGWLSPFETATKLYVVDGLTQVVYNTKLGINTKSGFVRYAGGSQNVVNVNIPYPNVTNAEVIQYGTSGKGRALKAYKMGNGRNSFIYNCAIHGWEDHWAGDGVELTKIGNKLIEHFQNNAIGDFTLYVIPVANPDGLSEGWTNNGSGRCTVVGGVDCNRDFPVGFTPGGEPRYYTGANPLSVPESRELANFVQGIKNRTPGETYLIDMHGWEDSLIGSAKIGEHFVHKLGLEAKYRFGSRGFLIEWSNSIGIISALLELPRNTHSAADVINGRYAEKIIEGLSEIICVKKSGWKEENGKWYYYDQDGNMKKGWQKLPRYADGTGDLVWFYFENDGVMQTGWKHIGPSWYYLNEKGIMQTGWQKLPRYIDGTGDLVWFYFNSEGMMQIGWKEIDNNWYYLDGKGIMQTGWHELPRRADGTGTIEWFYFYENGIMATNTTIDGWVIGADGVATKPGDSNGGNGGNDGNNGNGDYDNNSDYHRVLRIKEPFMKGEDVKKVQSKLNSLNYNVGSVDGVYGYATEEQVIRYQKAKGLSADGAVGESTWNSLMNSDSSGGGSSNEDYHTNAEYHRVLRVKNPLMRGEDVKKVQSKLNSLNYNVGSVDGAYGYGTEEQVIRFQQAKGLSADGAVGQNTWNTLMNSGSSGGGNDNGFYDPNKKYHRVLKISEPLMRGEDIKVVQAQLDFMGMDVGTVDGVYGYKTRDSVKRLQMVNGNLIADGEVGKNTHDYIFSEIGFLSNTGMFLDDNMFEFEDLNEKTPPIRLSFEPAVDVSAEIAFAKNIGDPNGVFSIYSSRESMTKYLNTSIGSFGVGFDINRLTTNFGKISYCKAINPLLNFYVNSHVFPKRLELVYELKVTFKNFLDGTDGIFYQRVYITLYPRRINNSYEITQLVQEDVLQTQSNYYKSPGNIVLPAIIILGVAAAVAAGSATIPYATVLIPLVFGVKTLVPN